MGDIPPLSYTYRNHTLRKLRMPRTKLQTPNFNLSRREDGYYVVRWTEDGTLRKKATGTKDPNEAEAFRARLSREYDKPELSEKPTIGEVIDAYFGTRKDVVADAKGLTYCHAPLKRILGPLFADTVTQTTVADYIKRRKAEGGQHRKGGRYADKPVSDPTINKELRALRAALKWAHGERLIVREPKFRIELSAGDTRERWITKDDANSLMAACAPHLSLFVLIALSTAKRREAILSLTWDRVSLALPGHESIDFGDDVGNKRRGKTPIAGNVRLIKALSEAKAAAKTDYVIEYRGERVKDVKTALRAACRRAGLEPFGAHTLKHSAITWMVLAGVAFERIAKFASTSKDVIEKVYGHHSPEFVAEASGALAF